MTLTGIFEMEGDGSQDEGTLYSLSNEFLEGARVLQVTPPTRVGYTSVTYYMLGHSAELMLKAFLYERSLRIDELKKIGHDLEKLVNEAKDYGLKANLEQVLQLAKVYKDKEFEYRTRKKKIFPSLDLLIKEIEVLQAVVFEKIIKSSKQE